MTVVVLFAGAGGTCEGLRQVAPDADVVGYDYDADACATARAAGHQRVQADLATLEPGSAHGTVDGIIGTPTCRPWSVANPTRRGIDDPRGELVYVPPRWVLALRPRWSVWECTPRALPMFRAMAPELQAVGYDVATGLVDAGEHGVAADRIRAVLVARLDGRATLPAPTAPGPRSMTSALGWEGAELVSNYGTNGDPRRRGRRRMDQPAFTITGRCGRNYFEWPDGRRRRMTVHEAAVLQGFRPDYPWLGGSISRQQQVGDTVPPAMAAAILRPLVAP